MGIADQICHYFETLQAEKKLKPGDKLPSYAELCRMFHTTYATVQRAFKTMEQRGIIKIVHGVGSFLSGGDTLDIDLFLTETTFPFSEMQAIVDEISEQNHLHLNVSLKPMPHGGIDLGAVASRVTITEADPWVRISGNLLDYSNYPEYESLQNAFDPRWSSPSNYQLPFYCFTYQGAVNLELLKQIGFKQEIHHFDTLSWWDELAAQCKAHQKAPAIRRRQQENLWSFSPFSLTVLLGLQENPQEKALFKTPLYETDCGKRIFEIMSSWEVCTGNISALRGAVDFGLGSWITVQFDRVYKLPADGFRIVPLRTGDRRILRYANISLQTLINGTVTESEKKRVWELLRHLVSKKTQRRICGITGAISPRHDMSVGDYVWATRNDFVDFLPKDGDIFVNNNMLPKEKVAVLGALYDMHDSYGIDDKIIRKAMDEKLR